VVKTNPVQIVIVGCGAVSQFFYTPALQALEQAGMAKVSGLVDPKEQPRAELQKSFPHARSYTDLAGCPLDSNILVIIASPPTLHAKQSIFALQRGAAVLCEKPMASSSAEAELMVQASSDYGAVLAIGFYRRFFPAAEAIKSILEKKPLGRLRSFTVQEGRKFEWAAASDSYFRRHLTPGGALYDTGVHLIDLLLWWLGEPASFSYQDDAMGGIEVNCQIELVYPGGERGSVRLSRDWETQNRYIFYFERGTVTHHVDEANHLSISVDGPFVLSGELKTIAAKSHGRLGESTARTTKQCFVEQLRNVIAAMQNYQPLRVPGEAGIRSLRFIEACYTNRKLMDMPWLTVEEENAAKFLSGEVS
jgi:predicted dehydrogenase